MPLLDLETRVLVKRQLDTLPQTVTLHVFTQEMECQFCREARELALELASIQPEKIKVEIHDFVKDTAAVLQYGIDKIPALVPVGKQDYGIRFYGIPAGYEFTSLLLSLPMVATGESGLSPVSSIRLSTITKPLHLKVYVTLTCPYCPAAVHTAQQMAVANPFITADMIEAAEFPQLTMQEQIMGVPKTVIEGVGSFEGALPEVAYVSKIMDLLAGGST
jgi:glutaredoxin-like protein